MTAARKLRTLPGILTYWLVECGPKLYLITTYPDSDYLFVQSYAPRRVISNGRLLRADIRKAIFGEVK